MPRLTFVRFASSVLFLCVLVTSLLRRATEWRSNRVQERLSVARLGCVIAPPGIVASLVAGGRQREEALDGGERARAIAATLRQLAERDERRLRRWKQRRR